MSIPISILPDWLQEAVRQIRLTQGIRAIEELAQNENGATWKWPAEWLGTLNEVRDTHADDYYQYYDATRSISPTVFAQIVATVRSRLQDFVLELCDLQWKMGQEPPPSREIQHLFNVTITNTAQGGSVATFDQRGQNVNYQYNAAGDINFGAVQNRQEFITELEKLKGELQKAAAATVIDADVATEAEYQLSKAVNQAKKPDADQKTVLEHINGAKTLIESVAAAGGLVTGLLTAAEHVQKFFGG